jgi:hypothetical protein
MAIHQDGTMDVRLEDGTTERRRFEVRLDAPFSNRYLERVQRYEPETRDNEEVMHFIDDIPLIVVRNAPADDPMNYGSDEASYVHEQLYRS